MEAQSKSRVKIKGSEEVHFGGEAYLGKNTIAFDWFIPAPSIACRS
jgi:hypothetical protein